MTLLVTLAGIARLQGTTPSLVAKMQDGELNLPFFSAQKFKAIEGLIKDFPFDNGVTLEIPLPIATKQELQDVLKCLTDEGTVNEAYCKQLVDEDWIKLSPLISYLDYEQLYNRMEEGLKEAYGSPEYCAYYNTYYKPYGRKAPFEKLVAPIQLELKKLLEKECPVFDLYALHTCIPSAHQQFALNNTHMISTSGQNFITLWDLTNYEPHVFVKENKNIGTLALDEDRIVYTTDENIKIRTIKDPKQDIIINKAHPGSINALFVVNNHIISADSNIKIWNLKKGKYKNCASWKSKENPASIKNLVGDQATLIAEFYEQRGVQIFDIEGLQLLQKISLPEVRSEIFFKNNNLFWGNYGAIYMRDLRTEGNIVFLKAHNSRIESFSMIQGNLISSGDKTVKIWDIGTRQCKQTFNDFTKDTKMVNQNIVARANDSLIAAFEIVNYPQGKFYFYKKAENSTNIIEKLEQQIKSDK
jgi:hypothetical protein